MRYIIFPYEYEGLPYIDAYPIHLSVDMIAKQLEGTSISYLIVEAPSRTQARKEAYKLWIDSTGKGFNKMPLRPNK